MPYFFVREGEGPNSRHTSRGMSVLGITLQRDNKKTKNELKWKQTNNFNRPQLTDFVPLNCFPCFINAL